MALEHHDKLNPSQTKQAWAQEERLARQRPRVIVAEDHLEMRALISDMLRLERYEVTETRDGAALHPSEDPQIPDLIITDIWMPGCTGLEVLARLRRFDWATRVIVITAFGDEAAHAEARRLGAALVLDKPFELATLRAAALGLAPVE